MNLNKSKTDPGNLTSHNLGRSVINTASQQHKDTNTNRRRQQRSQEDNLPKVPFVRENDIQVDLSRKKIKLEIKEEPTEMNTMDKGTNHQGIPKTGTDPLNILRMDSSDSDISVRSVELKIVEDEEADGNVESLSDADEKVEISDDDLERMFAQKDKEIAFLRKQVKDLKKKMKEQDEKITDLNKSVEKHETVLNRFVEVGGGAVLENVKNELKAIELKDGGRKSEAGNSGAEQGQREQATVKDQEHQGSPSEPSASTSRTSGMTNEDVGGSRSKDNIEPKRKAVTFGETFYEGETPQPQQFYQRDRHLDRHRGSRRRDWYLHDSRTTTQPYKRQAKDPYYLSPTSNRNFRARGQRYRGRGAQCNFRSSDPNTQSSFNKYCNPNKCFSVANETSHQLDQSSNSEYLSGGVNEKGDTQPENEMEDDEVFLCPHCPWKFGERQNMEKHCEAMHKFYKCHMCEKQYGFQESLRRHLASKHDINEMNLGN